MRRSPHLEHLEDRLAPTVTVLKNYTGLSYLDNINENPPAIGLQNPPDTCGAAGPSSYVETVNQSIAIYSPRSNPTLPPIQDSISDFMFGTPTNTGPLKTVHSGSGLDDPVVAFDEVTQQFVVGVVNGYEPNNVANFDIAVSTSPNPATLTTSDWNFYSIPASEPLNASSGSFNPDYPGNFGYNADAFVITLNMEVAGTSKVDHVQVISINQSDLAAGVSQTNLHVYHNDIKPSNVKGDPVTAVVNLRPTTMHDSQVINTATDPMWLIQEHGDHKSLDVIEMTNVLSSTPTFTNTNVAVKQYANILGVQPQQPGSPSTIETVGSRILKAAESNGIIVACQHINVGTTEDDVRWYEIDVSSGTPVRLDQGNVSAGPNTYLYYPAIDINSQGDIGMTFMRSGTDVNPQTGLENDYMSVWVTGRTPSDPAGTMEPPVLVQPGVTTYNDQGYSVGGNPTNNRTGDLSGINVDNAGNFWIANEYATSADPNNPNWGTAIARFSLFSIPSVSVINSYSGLDINSTQGFVPPDPQGAVGPSSYVETVNQSVALYPQKTSNAGSITDTLRHFYTTVGGLAKTDSSSGLSDPVIVFDEFTQQFVIGDQDVDSSTHLSNFDIAVSKTANPASLTTTDWRFYQINTTEAGFDADYPGNLGYNADGFVFTLNIFFGNSLDHVQINTISQADLAAGVTKAKLHHYQTDVFAASVRPTTMHDARPGDPMWLLEEHGDDQSIDVVKMTNILSTNPTFVVTTVPVQPYNQANPPLNPNGSVITFNTDSSILKAAEANYTIVACQQVAASPTENDARWYEFNVSSGTPVLKDQGNVSQGNNTYAEYSGIDINSQGAIGMSFAQSGTDAGGDFISVYVTGRAPGDPLGTMRPPTLVKTGTANNTDGREGDLSGINIDSDGSFWICNEVGNNEFGGSWGTQIVHFKVPLPSANVTNQFTGLDFKATATVPPYTQGAAGPSSYLEVAGQTAQLFNKITGATIKTDALSDFFFTQGGLPQTDSGSSFSADSVVYDEFTNQFIIGDLDNDLTTHLGNFDLAVSKTSNPTTFTSADWNFYQIKTTENNGTSSGTFDGQNTGNMGYNHDALVFTVNMNVPTGDTGTPHIQVNSISQASLAAEGATLSAFQNDTGTATGEFDMRPTVMHDSKAGDPMWFVKQHSGTTSIDVIKMANILTNAASFTTTNLSVNSYTDIQSVPPLQPNGMPTVAGPNATSRIVKAAEANNTIVAANAVSVSSTEDDIQWYEIDVSSGTPTLKDQGRVSQGNNNYAFQPDIDINSQGDIGMTWVTSGTLGAKAYMSPWVTGRAPGDPAGTMGAPVVIQSGQANYYDSNGQLNIGPGAINVDSDGSFWVAHVYANTESTANWGTAIANFSIGPIVDLWTGANQAVDLNWSDGANWSLGHAPTVNNIAKFTNNDPSVKQVNSVDDGVYNIAGLQIDGSWNGTLTVQGNLTLPGISLNEWDSGTISPSAGVSVINNGRLLINNLGVLTLNGGTLTNNGNMIQNGEANLQAQNAATVNNAGLYAFFTDTGLQQGSGAADTVVNTGVLEKAQGTGTTTIAPNLNNTGTVEVLSGTVDLTGAVTQVSGNTLTAGNWSVLSSASTGATLDITSGNFATIGSGATVTLSGGNATFSNLTNLASVAAGGAFSLLLGQGFSTAGAFTNSGTLTLDAGSVLTVNGAFTQTGTGVLLIGVHGTAKNFNYGSITSTGQITLAGRLNKYGNPGFIPPVGAAFDIIDNQSGLPISGHFASLTEGKTFSFTVGTQTLTFQITYKGGSKNNSFVVTRIS
jgi:hypothetical protein